MQELWISDLLADAHVGIIGGTPSSFQTLVGSKEEGTDPHSMTASLLGISRDNAKTVVYSRRYSAGLKSMINYMREFRKTLTSAEAKQLASDMFAKTKGKKIEGRWRLGTESVMFNELERIATSSDPRTPTLKRTMSDAIHPRFTGHKDYLTSKINFCVQSSGVDFLHICLTAVDYLCSKYDIDARLCITIHDEYRYIVLAKDSARFCLALQIAHLWTRAYISQSVGLYDLPASVAWFSGVDIDFTIRKSPDKPAITPSQPLGLSLGRVTTIQEILEVTKGSLLKS